MAKLKPKGPVLIDTQTKMVLRKAYAPEATVDERERGTEMFVRSFKTILTVACENSEWMKGQIRSLGAGPILSSILTMALVALCKIVKP